MQIMCKYLTEKYSALFASFELDEYKIFNNFYVPCPFKICAIMALHSFLSFIAQSFREEQRKVAHKLFKKMEKTFKANRDRVLQKDDETTWGNI